MSGTGESCGKTCETQGMMFSWAEPPKNSPITPLLVGHEPASKQWPWTFVECYVAKEDRYHSVNSNAWGVPAKTPQSEIAQVADWSHEDCRLACPCAARQECGWVQPPACAPEFEYKGKLYTGCPMADDVKPWCMHHHHHLSSNQTFAEYGWSYCINTCPKDEGEKTPLPNERCGWKLAKSCELEFDYEGTHYVGCTSVDHDTPWCSNTNPYSGSWSHCEYSCINATADEQHAIDLLNNETQDDDELCSWRPSPNCSTKFRYKGMDYEGCAEYVDHPTPWCSHDRMHVGKWSECERFCTKASF